MFHYIATLLVLLVTVLMYGMLGPLPSDLEAPQPHAAEYRCREYWSGLGSL